MMRASDGQQTNEWMALFLPTPPWCYSLVGLE